ncbi:hypothetical protein OE88DRAFT_1632087 [Heliocybe sulcata]|uniref:LCCL domain-containing protein n=1 Tax=Heliocybe sulcata TaxID=5364 RepID=A0A5C3N0J8_9AGAM|nr:hypothetical protein OE88DRAFT_1632087 [Heliocybe sulcata]
MAAPKQLTTLNFTGTWVLNKSLSDPNDKILEMQGVGWIKRKAIASSSLTLHVTHDKDEHNSIERVQTKQVLSGGLSTEQKLTLNWEEKHSEGTPFGDLIVRSKRMPLAEIQDAFLKEGWTADTVEHGVIYTRIESDTEKPEGAWSLEQVWGFEDIAGDRRHTRHVKGTDSKGDVVTARLVYDYSA